MLNTVVLQRYKKYPLLLMSEYSNILAVFESHGLSSTDLISKEALHNLLTRMNGRQQFDTDVFLEMWEQCREDSLGKIEIKEFVDVVYRARHILSNRVVNQSRKHTELKNQERRMVEEFQKERNSKIRGDVEKQIIQLQEEIRKTHDAITDSTIDLEVLNKVFFKPGTYRQSVFVSPVADREIDVNQNLDGIALPEQPLGFDLPIRAKPQQRLLLLFVLIGILLQLLIMDSKIGLLNLLNYIMILVFFVLPIVPKHYWIINLTLLGVSNALDIAWLALYASTWWWKPSEHSNSLGFQRYGIVMTSILMIVKSFAAVLLFIGFRPTSSQVRQSRMSSRFV